MTSARDTDLIPPCLIAAIQAAAEEGNRPARSYRVVFNTEDLTEAELETITEGGMDPRHDHLNAELEQG